MGLLQAEAARRSAMLGKQVDQKDSQGLTALMVAAEKGSIEIAKSERCAAPGRATNSHQNQFFPIGYSVVSRGEMCGSIAPDAHF